MKKASVNSIILSDKHVKGVLYEIASQENDCADFHNSSSDFILMNNSLNSIYFIIYFSKKIKNNIKFNLFWAFIYNLIMIPIASGAFAFLGLYLNPLYCSILMIVSSISVCLNSLLLFRFKKSKNYV